MNKPIAASAAPEAGPRAPDAPLVWANLAAQSAEQLCLAALPIVAVLALDAGPGIVGTLATAQTLPYLLLAMPLGLLADRWPRRRLMLGAEGLRALTLLALAAIVAGGQVSLVALAVLGFVGAVGTVGFSVAAPALLPAIVAREQLAAANRRIELARSLAFAAGPALAGVLVAWAGASPAFAVAAALSVMALVLLTRLHEPPREAGVQRHPLDDLREGARFVLRHAWLRPMLLTAIVWNLAWFTLQAAYVPYAMSRLGLDAAGVGFTLAACGAGMVLGAFASRWLLARAPFGLAVVFGPLMSVLAAGVMAASLLWPWPGLAALSMFLFGAGPIVWTISTTTLRQHVTPPALLGRAGAIFLTVNAGARPLGSLLGAALGATSGASACLVAAALGFGLQAWLVWGSPLRDLRQLPR